MTQATHQTRRLDSLTLVWQGCCLIQGFQRWPGCPASSWTFEGLTNGAWDLCEVDEVDGVVTCRGCTVCSQMEDHWRPLLRGQRTNHTKAFLYASRGKLCKQRQNLPTSGKQETQPVTCQLPYQVETEAVLQNFDFKGAVAPPLSQLLFGISVEGTVVPARAARNFPDSVVEWSRGKAYTAEHGVAAI